MIAATSARILTAPIGRVWRFTHFCSVASLLEKWFTCHHSFPYFLITIFPTAFSFRSRMTGSQVIPFCKKLPFIFLLQLAPSDGLRLHTFLSLKAKSITHFYSVTLLLEKWFACFPTSGDGFYMRHFVIFVFLTLIFYSFVFAHIKNMISFFLNVSFPRTRREVPSLARR